MALSYVHGASTQPLIGKTIGALFDETCAAHPETLALIRAAPFGRMTGRTCRERLIRE